LQGLAVISKFCHAPNSVCLIESDTFDSLSFKRVSNFINFNVFANNKVALLVLLTNVFPELSVIKESFIFCLGEIVHLGDTTRHVYKSFAYLSSI
jgi:hypothetical protein